MQEVGEEEQECEIMRNNWERRERRGGGERRKET
jgi:hypothetical protein